MNLIELGLGILLGYFLFIKVIIPLIEKYEKKGVVVDESKKN